MAQVYGANPVLKLNHFRLLSAVEREMGNIQRNDTFHYNEQEQEWQPAQFVLRKSLRFAFSKLSQFVSITIDTQK